MVDYREINKATISDSFPFPDLYKEIRSIPRSSWFSQIDLAMGYHQIELESNAQKYTAFVTPDGQYEYTRVPFCLKNAPRVFQRVIREIFKEFSYVKTFLDDILVFSNTEAEHLQHLETVINKIISSNLAVNVEKSHFCQQEVVYLGHCISASGIKPETSKVPEMRRLIPPKGIRGMQRLCGFLNWFRPFIPGLSTKLHDVTNKLKKKSSLDWNQEDTQRVEEIFKEVER